MNVGFLLVATLQLAPVVSATPYGIVSGDRLRRLLELQLLSPAQDDMIVKQLDYTHDWHAHFRTHVFPSIDTINISQACSEAWSEIEAAEDSNKFWDSFGVVGAGLLDGNTRFLGSSQECANAKSPDYRVSRPFPDVTPRFVHYIGEEVSVWHVLLANMVVGICAPTACTDDEMHQIVYNTHHHGPARLPPFIHAVTSKAPLRLTPGFVVGCVLFSALGALVLAATAADVSLDVLVHYVTKVEEKGAEQQPLIGDSSADLPAALDTTEDESKPAEAAARRVVLEGLPGLRYLLCFSFKANMYGILSSGGGRANRGHIECLDGLRVMSLGWVCLGHTFLYVGTVVDNPLYLLQRARSFLFQGVASASPSVDTFFLLSGLLVMHNTLKALEGRRRSLLQFWLLFYLRRLVRLWPAMLLTILFTVSLFQLWGLHLYSPNWQPQDPLIHACSGTRWLPTAFFLNDFIRPRDSCIGWTWYVANDMTFFLLSPPLILLIKRHSWVGRGAVSALVLGSCLICLVATAVENLPPSDGSPLFSNFRVLVANYAVGNPWTDRMYYTPYCRFMSYGTGLLLGHFIYTHRTLPLTPGQVAGMYLSSVALAGTAVYVTYFGANGHAMGRAGTALYNGSFRLMWSVAVGQLVVLCHFGYGWALNHVLSANFWKPLAKVTYVAYLLHALAIVGYLDGLEEPAHFTVSNFVLIYTGLVVCVYVIAVPLSCFIEAPFLRLFESILHPPPPPPRPID